MSNNECMVTTGYNFEKYNITQYIGITSGESVIGTGLFSEFSANISDLLGCENNAFSSKIVLAKQNALKQLKYNAVLVGGNAIIGVDFDYILFANNMVGVVANGTAVRIEKNKSEEFDIKRIIDTYNLNIPFVLQYARLIKNSNYSKATVIINAYSMYHKLPYAFSAEVECTTIFDDSFISDKVYMISDSMDNDLECSYTSVVDFPQIENPAVIKSVSVYVNEYIINSEIISAEKDETKRIVTNLNRVTQLREQLGKDVVTDLAIEESNWICYCGRSHSTDIRECPICHRHLGMYIPDPLAKLNQHNNVHEMINDVTVLKNAKEIFDYFNQDESFKVSHPSLYDELDSLVKLERLYGNQKSSSMQKIKNYYQMN